MNSLSDVISYRHGWYRRCGDTMRVFCNNRYPIMPVGFEALEEPYISDRTEEWVFFSVRIKGWSKDE